MLAWLRPHRGFLWLLLASLALGACGLDWGVPSRKGWAPDELLPQDVLRARQHGFAAGWYERYPPLHYRLLSLAYGPWLPDVQDLEALPLEDHALLVRVGRALSLVFWAGLLAAVQACGLRLLTPRGALIATTLVALTLPLVFYAKLANLEVPYLCWWALSLVFYLRALEGRRGATLPLLALCAALCVTTKDQAFALFVLVPLPVLARRLRDEAGSFVGRLARTLAARDVWAALAVFATAFVLVHGLVTNPEGFVAHVSTMLAAGRSFRQFPATFAGHVALLEASARNVVFVLGAPATLAALAGLLLALAQAAPGKRLLALLVPGISHQVFFLGLALYCYDRFVLPWAILLAFFGGSLFDALLARRAVWRALGIAWLGTALGFGLVRAAALDAQMLHDGRYFVEDWVAARVTSDEIVGQVAPSLFLPRLKPAGLRAVGPDIEDLQERQPRFLLQNVAYGRRAEAGSLERAFLNGLEGGRTAYTLVLEHRWRSPWLLAFDPGGLDAAAIDSNLSKVNPLIRVYERPASTP